MNKKFLSAILFGALMVTSTGTFVSCKDYDDDIKDLQTQINSNKDAIAALQKLVGEGNWVTGITSIADGFTVTMSNGQTTTITAIKGADGKDGVEWTIGEDGFWYKDGEKTDHQAVAEDGKPGATAPSPSISADGMWVVYEWDATKGEFVATTTEIPAQGTSAYVVKKDGVYVLHIADETGAFQDVTLPATSDSFVVTAPYSDIEIYFEHARWNPTTNTAEYKALVEQYPELKDIAKNALVKQGGYLPVLVTPASVELSDDFSFSLQQVNGKTANVTIANPVKGLHNADFVTDDETGRTTMQTRSVDASACYWTLSVEPAIEKNEYVTLSQKPVALVAENAKGTVVKTEFAYKVLSKSAASEATIADKGSATYASEIDLLAYDEKVKGYPVTITGNYIGYQIITLTNNYQIEKYGLSIVDNRILKIENMPSDVTSIDVNLSVVTISLTGKTVKNENVVVTIGQEVAATGNLSAQSLTLDGKDQIVKWNLSELGLSALDLDKVLCGDVNVLVLRKYTDDEGKEHAEVVFNGAPTYYNAAGKITTYNKDSHACVFS